MKRSILVTAIALLISAGITAQTNTPVKEQTQTRTKNQTHVHTPVQDQAQTKTQARTQVGYQIQLQTRKRERIRIQDPAECPSQNINQPGLCTARNPEAGVGNGTRNASMARNNFRTANGTCLRHK